MTAACEAETATGCGRKHGRKHGDNGYYHTCKLTQETVGMVAGGMARRVPWVPVLPVIEDGRTWSEQPQTIEPTGKEATVANGEVTIASIDIPILLRHMAVMAEIKEAVPMDDSDDDVVATTAIVATAAIEFSLDDHFREEEAEWLRKGGRDRCSSYGSNVLRACSEKPSDAAMRGETVARSFPKKAVPAVTVSDPDMNTREVISGRGHLSLDGDMMTDVPCTLLMNMADERFVYW